MKEIISKLISKEVKISEKEIESLVEIPKNSELGDYAFPCFSLSKSLKKNPVEIAASLSQKIKSSKFEKIVSNGPYINFFINKNEFSSEVLKKILKDKEKYGSSKKQKNKKTIIDFSGPNIGKPMHIGHIRSTIIGDSLSKLANFTGQSPIEINYLGDIGLHIGKLIVAYDLWVDNAALSKNPTQELLRLYVKFCKEEKSEFQEGQDIDYEGNEWTDKAKEKLKLIEEGDKKTIKIWKEIQKKSKKGFDKVYKILNVSFKRDTGQSMFSDPGKKAINSAIKEGLAKREESGAVYVDLKDSSKKYILRSNGTASYITQDIGAAIARDKKYHFDEMIYVTDYRQILHFKQLFEILSKFGYKFSEKCRHVPFGTIKFGDEIVSTREGKVILLEDVLEKAIAHAEEELSKRKTSGNSEKIALAAIKYAVLKSEPMKDIAFNWDSILSFEGNTGPYLLYSYARAKSILRKVKSKGKIKISSITEKENELIKTLANYPEIVKKAYEDLAPNLIANYAYDLSQKFNEFYHSSQVIGSENESMRLALVSSFSIVLKSSISLLGIQVLEKM